MKIIKFIIPSLLLFTPIGVFAEGCEIYNTDPAACQEAAASGCYWSSENDSVLGVISVCNQCVSGDHSTGTKCEPCPTGSYCVNGVETPCPVGTYNANPGSSSNTACTPCESGTYNDQTGQSSCKGCTNLPTGSSYFGDDNTPKYLTGENYSGQESNNCPWEFECSNSGTYAECSDGSCRCNRCPDQYTISSNRSFPSKITFIDSGYQSTGSICASVFKPIKVVVNTEPYGNYIAGIENFLMAANSDGEWRISPYESPLESFQRKNNFYGLSPQGYIDYSVGDLVSEKAGKEEDTLFSLGVGCGASTCPDCDDPQNAEIRDCKSCHTGWCRIYMIDSLNYGDYVEVDSNGDKIIRVKLSSLSPKGPVLEVSASVLDIDYEDTYDNKNKKHMLLLQGNKNPTVSLYSSFDDFKAAKGGNVASFYYGVAPDKMNNTIKICHNKGMAYSYHRYYIDLKELVPKKHCPSESDKNYYNFSYDQLEPTPWDGMVKGLPPLSMDENKCICGGSENKRGYVIFAFSGCGPCPVGCYCDTDGPHQCPGGFTTKASGSTKKTDCVLRYDTEFIESYNGEKNCVYGCNSGFNHIFDDYKLKIQN